MNPFAEPEEGTEVEESADTATPTEESTEDVEAALAEADPEGEEDQSYGKFEDEESPTEDAAPEKGKPSRGVQKRISRLVSERNAAQDELTAAQVELAKYKATAEYLADLDGVVSEKYQNNLDLLRFDATFMETFATLAEKDPTLAQAAARVKAAMQQNGETIVTTPKTPATPAEEQAPSENPALSAVLERDVKRNFAEVLGGHNLKPHIVNAVTRDVLAEMDASELVDATPAEVVEMAKLYLRETGIPFSEALLPAKDGEKVKPSTKGSSRPAASPKADAQAAEGQERPKYKTREELDAARAKRLNQFFRENFNE